MELVNPIRLLKEAQAKGYALPAFNVHNLETIQAVVEVACEEKSPVIVQTTPGTLKHAGVKYIASITRAAAELYTIPIVLHLDHCESYDMIKECLDNGYTSVMIDGSKLCYEENVRLVRSVVALAHGYGAAVEAELGKIGGTEDDLTVSEHEATLTVPTEAEQFVQETQVDSLAVAIGTAHGNYRGEPKLDFPRLSAIAEVVEVPLILHGASGVPDASVREAIRRGVCKVNIATELKDAMGAALRQIFENDSKENDPRKYMGAAKLAVKDVVRNKIRLCGSQSADG